MIHLLGKQVDAAIAAFLQLIHQAVCDPVNAPLVTSNSPMETKQMVFILQKSFL